MLSIFKRDPVKGVVVIILAVLMLVAGLQVYMSQGQDKQKIISSQPEEREVVSERDTVLPSAHAASITNNKQSAKSSIVASDQPHDTKDLAQPISKEVQVHAIPKSAEMPDSQVSLQPTKKVNQISFTPKSLDSPDSRISRLAISKVKTRKEAVDLHRIITLRFLDQLEMSSSSISNEARVRQNLEDTADRYYLLQKVATTYKMEPLGYESLQESERQRVEKLISTLGYSSPTARAADAAFAKFDLLVDEHIVHTLAKWLRNAPSP